MKFGSLFTGIGGFDLGFERAGMTCAWQCEIDKNAQKVLKKHWPNVPLHEDVRTIGKHNLDPVELICGGFPCQDVSVAGKREGLDGERSGLWFEFHRILTELRPRWCVIENVPGLLSSNGGRDFAVILRGLADIGYCVSWRVLDAQYDGLAQRRKRVFLVGSLGNGGSAEVLFESESLSWDSKPSRASGKVAPTISSSGAGTSRTGNERTEVDMLVSTPWDAQTKRVHDARGIAPTLAGSDGGGGQRTLNVAVTLTSGGNPNSNMPGRHKEDDFNLVAVARPLKAGGNSRHDESHETYIPDLAPSETARDRKGERVDVAEPSLIVASFDERNVTSNVNRTKVEFGAPSNTLHSAGMSVISKEVIPIQEIGKRQSGTPMNRVGYGESGDPMFTLQASAEHGIATRLAVRRLTAVECARLQGFPDDHCSMLADSGQYRAYGNAVAVPVAYWIGKQIMGVERG